MSVHHRTLLETGTSELDGGMCPIERSFPVAEISLLAERESWRKEIFRPIYHIHKWWANRLGSIFRAIVLGSIASPTANIWEDFYKQHDFSDKIVLDPFMGSGTTLGEAAKLGARPIGCDVNPVSTFAVTQALTRVDIEKLEQTFGDIERDVKDEIGQYYMTIDPESREPIPVLYYFWVKVVETPFGETIPLFSSYVFSKNAYPKKKPGAKIICPNCWQVNTDRYDAESLICAYCYHTFNPQQGPANGRHVTNSYGNVLEIKNLLPRDGTPPQHRLYALMALRSNGEKIYLAPQAHDLALVEQARNALRDATLPLPIMPVRPGHNTNQARNYQYMYWRDFFNDRQLLCLGLLLRRIMQIPERDIRDQFLCLFSTTLEFNNLFCSFKGEGTGAVRHMFSHHILKPERAPLENNVWGTPQSSGSFLKLFKSKLLKAKLYLDQPFDLQLDEATNDAKATNCIVSKPINLCVTHTWEEFSAEPGRALVLNGDSASLPIPDQVVDAVVTDPPYFDFIHYSELSDFFFAWLAPVLAMEYSFFNRPTSHHEGEVQNKQPEAFAVNLARVFSEAHRVLKAEGVLVFSFHHSRADGWTAIQQALTLSGFCVVAAYPVYAEMKGASPKTSTKEPISVDIILVCKKYDTVSRDNRSTAEYAQELKHMGIELSQTDYFNIAAGLLLVEAARDQISLGELKQRLSRLKESVIKL